MRRSPAALPVALTTVAKVTVVMATGKHLRREARGHLAVVVERVGNGDVAIHTDAAQMKQGC